MVPLHTGWFGVQIRGPAQVVVAAVHDAMVEHVSTSVELSPLALQSRSSLPEQNVVPAAQTVGTHVPPTQTWLLPLQSSVTSCCRPFSEQVTTFSASVRQVFVPGVQSRLLHVAVVPSSAQLSSVPQATVLENPLPSLLQVATALPTQAEVPAAQTGGTHEPMHASVALASAPPAAATSPASAPPVPAPPVAVAPPSPTPPDAGTPPNPAPPVAATSPASAPSAPPVAVAPPSPTPPVPATPPVPEPPVTVAPPAPESPVAVAPPVPASFE